MMSQTILVVHVSAYECSNIIIISTVILLLSADSRMVVVSYKRKYVHEVLDNCLVKLSQENMWLCEVTVPT